MKQILILITAGLLALPVMAQNQQDAIAAQGLQNFKQLSAIQPRNNDSSSSDLSNASLGAPIATAIIPLDKLKSYTAGQPATNFIVNTEALLYPVLDGRTKRIISTISVERTRDKWISSAFGADKRNVEKIAIYATGAGSYKLVKIIALNLSFISIQNGNGLQLIPLQDDRERNIVQGRPIAAEKVLEAYVAAANAYNGLPL